MTKATQNGICQYCGREHAVNAKTGKLAIHGYRIIWNSFTNDCQGSKELPLQVERRLTDEYVVSLRAEAGRLRESAATLTPDTEGLLLQVYGSLDYVVKKELLKGLVYDSPEYRKVVGKWYTKDQAAVLGCRDESWIGATNSYKRALVNQAAQMEGFATQLTEMADRIHGTPLLERVNIEDKRQRQWFGDRREAYAFERAKQADGYTTSSRRDRNYGNGVTVWFEKKE